MTKFAFALPVRKGARVASLYSLCSGNLEAFIESRRRLGIRFERTYLRRTATGSMTLFYFEGDQGFFKTIANLLSWSGFEHDFVGQMFAVHDSNAFDLLANHSPQLVADWVDPTVADRQSGTMFSVPLLPESVSEIRLLCKLAFEYRRDELTHARRTIGRSRETIFVVESLRGAELCAYVEGPHLGDNGLSEKAKPFSYWFDSEMAKVLTIDPNATSGAAGQLIWTWEEAAPVLRRSPVRALMPSSHEVSRP